jgi:hypothetical protein
VRDVSAFAWVGNDDDDDDDDDDEHERVKENSGEAMVLVLASTPTTIPAPFASERTPSSSVAEPALLRTTLEHFQSGRTRCSFQAARSLRPVPRRQTPAATASA